MRTVADTKTEQIECQVSNSQNSQLKILLTDWFNSPLKLKPLFVPLALQVEQRGTKMCPGFSSESIYAGNFYLENYLISSLNDFCKRKKTPENGYLDSSRLVWPHFRPNRGTGPHCFTQCRETPSFSAVELQSGARCTT